MPQKGRESVFLRTCWAHHLAKLGAKHVEDADPASHEQDEVQHGGVAQQLIWNIGDWQSIGGNGANWAMTRCPTI